MGNRAKSRSRDGRIAHQQYGSTVRHQWLIAILTVSASVAAAIIAAQITASAQLEQVKLAREQFGADQMRIRHDLAEANANTLATRFESALANLASPEPERRLVGFRSTLPFVSNDEYRNRIRSALIEAIGRQIVSYAKPNSTVAPEELRPNVLAAAEALRQSTEGGHLREVIVGVYGKLRIAGVLSDADKRSTVSEQNRRAELFGPLRDNLGNFLFCKYLPSCANRIDFQNTIDGTRFIWNTGAGMTDTASREIDPEALFALSGYPAYRAQFLMNLYASCAVEDRDAIRRRACDRAMLNSAGKPVGPPESCSLLSSLQILPGGWIGRTGGSGSIKVDGSGGIKLGLDSK